MLRDVSNAHKLFDNNTLWLSDCGCWFRIDYCCWLLATACEFKMFLTCRSCVTVWTHPMRYGLDWPLNSRSGANLCQWEKTWICLGALQHTSSSQVSAGKLKLSVTLACDYRNVLDGIGFPGLFCLYILSQLLSNMCICMWLTLLWNILLNILLGVALSIGIWCAYAMP